MNRSDERHLEALQAQDGFLGGGNDDANSVSDDGSIDSEPSDIPDEHIDGMNHNEYIKQYTLKIKAITITWTRDSQGLFDYETLHLAKTQLETDREM